jgi:hypothetical protein
MGRISHLQASFTSGEISPRLLGRVDLAKYQTALASCRDMILMPHGGATRRPGTRFVAEVKDSSKDVRLIPFEFSTQQAYILEFGDFYMRCFMNEGQIMSGLTPFEIATTYPEAHLQKLRYTQNADTLFVVHSAHRPALLTRTDHTAWTLADMEFIDGPYLDENTDQSKTITPSGLGQYVVNGFFDNDIGNWTDKSTGTNAKILWDNSGYMTLVGVTGGSGYGEQSVTLPTAGVEYTLEFEVKAGPLTVRIGTATGGQQVLSDTVFEAGVQTLKFTPAATSIFLGFLHTANAARAVDNVSISYPQSITLTSSFDLFQAGHVGAFFRMKHGSRTGYVKITAVGGLRTATATVMEPLASTAATYMWREGAWSDYQGWPSSVTFHQQRLFFAGTTRSPQTVWGSRTGRYTDFTPGVNADDPITVTMASSMVNAIQWLVSAKNLAVGTSGGEWRLGPADSDAALKPDTVSAAQETTFGSSQTVMPVRVGNVTLFVQRNGRKVRELTYDYQTNGWVAPDLSLLAEHITVGGITEADYAQDPDSIVWCVRTDGVLLGLTYNRMEQVVGWHRHFTDGLFEHVAAIPKGEIDQVWVVVNRTVGGTPKRYIEFFTQPFVDQDRDDAIFLDASLSYAGAPVTVVTGLDHLEGKTVDILADGSVRTPQVVTGGQVSFAKAASTVCVGLPFVSEIETLDPEGGAEDGTSQGKTKRVSKVVLRVHRSLGFQVGPVGGKMETPPFRSSATPLGQAPDLFTGDLPVNIEGRYGSTSAIVVRQTQPYPLTVLAAMATITVNS